MNKIIRDNIITILLALVSAFGTGAAAYSKFEVLETKVDQQEETIQTLQFEIREDLALIRSDIKDLREDIYEARP